MHGGVNTTSGPMQDFSWCNGSSVAWVRWDDGSPTLVKYVIHSAETMEWECGKKREITKCFVKLTILKSPRPSPTKLS